MTEEEYTTTANLARIRAVMFIMADCLTGEEYGIDTAEWRKAYNAISDIQDKLLGTIKIKPT